MAWQQIYPHWIAMMRVWVDDGYGNVVHISLWTEDYIFQIINEDLH